MFLVCFYRPESHPPHIFHEQNRYILRFSSSRSAKAATAHFGSRNVGITCVLVSINRPSYNSQSSDAGIRVDSKDPLLFEPPPSNVSSPLGQTCRIQVKYVFPHESVTNDFPFPELCCEGSARPVLSEDRPLNASVRHRAQCPLSHIRLIAIGHSELRSGQVP